MKNARKVCAWVFGAVVVAPALALAQNNSMTPAPAAQPVATQTATPVAQPVAAAPAAAPAHPSYKELLQKKKARHTKYVQDRKALSQKEMAEIKAVKADKTLNAAQRKAKIAAIKKSYAGQRKGMWSDFKRDMDGIGKDMEFWRSHHHKKMKKAMKKAAMTPAATPAPAPAAH